MAKLNHIGFFVSDIDKSVKFYKNIFGFKEVDHFMSGDAKITTLDMGEVLLELICPPDAVITPPTGNWSHLAIYAPEFDEVVARVDEKKLEKRMMTMDIGGRLCFFNDPDGHTIEISEKGL